MRRLLLSLALAASMASTAAYADAYSEADQEACTPDVFRLCQDFIPNETQIVACLNGKLRQLSPACHQVMAPAPKRSQTAHRLRHARKPVSEAARN